MRYLKRLGPIAVATVLGGALLSSGCQARPTPAAQPAPAATSLFVRNFTAFDVAIYVVPRSGEKPVWLTNISVGSSRSLPLAWSDLQADGALVVRTQIVGSSKTWTSEPLVIDDGIVGVLDLKSNRSLTTDASVLRGFTAQAFNAAMR